MSLRKKYVKYTQNCCNIGWCAILNAFQITQENFKNWQNLLFDTSKFTFFIQLQNTTSANFWNFCDLIRKCKKSIFIRNKGTFPSIFIYNFCLSCKHYLSISRSWDTYGLFSGRWIYLMLSLYWANFVSKVSDSVWTASLNIYLQIFTF